MKLGKLFCKGIVWLCNIYHLYSVEVPEKCFYWFSDSYFWDLIRLNSSNFQCLLYTLNWLYKWLEDSHDVQGFWVLQKRKEQMQDMNINHKILQNWLIHKYAKNSEIYIKPRLESIHDSMGAIELIRKDKYEL